MIGEVIKDFKLIRRLGAGGVGEVWAAEQQIIHTRVAIKLLHAQISTDRGHIQRFFSEAVAASKIKHSGIVKIFDVGFHAGRAFLIMELLEGESLSSRMESAGRLPVGAVAEIARQIASILEATHAEGIVHRDLKPDNVFLVADAELASKERVKILDFGFAKLGLGLTKSSETMGTPAYIAPEQWGQASAVDGRADVYSLGCIVFKLCCGRLPFEAESIYQWYAKHREETPPRARSLVPELPAELDELIARMLAKSPEDRPSLRDLTAAFARITTAQPHRLAPTAPPETSSGRSAGNQDSTLRGAAGAFDPSGGRKRRRGPVIAAVAAVAVVTVVVVLVALRSPDPKPPLVSPDVKTDVKTDAKAAPAAPVDAPLAPPGPLANRWVAIAPPAKAYLLGVADSMSPEQSGFRASRGIRTPAQAYELQEHEVTWSELDPWLARQGTHVDLPLWAEDAVARAALPATNITWTMAREYCHSIGGELPTEEQWEYAARGSERRSNPWGEGPLDRQMTRVFAGAPPSPVMKSAQDRTPDPVPICDLAGNVQEWTLGLWRGDRAGADESDVQQGQTTSRAIRGLPLAGTPPATLPLVVAAVRQRLCATGLCVEKTRPTLAYVGFRCARSPGT